MNIRFSRRSPVVIRRGRSSDRRALTELLATHGLGTEVDPRECFVAEKESILAGVARLESSGEDAYLRPIAVALEARGQAIGRALIEQLFLISHCINVIARGETAAFYHRMGFVEHDWAYVPRRYKQECELCPDLAECRPVPMKWINETGQVNRSILEQTIRSGKEEL